MRVVTTGHPVVHMVAKEVVQVVAVGGVAVEEVLVEGRAVIHINANARLTHASVTTTSPTRNAKMKTRMLRPLKLMDVIWDMLVMQR